MTEATSLWAAAAIELLTDSNSEPLHRQSTDEFNFEVKSLGDSLLIIADFEKNNHIAFRTAYSTNGFNDIRVIDASPESFSVRLTSAAGEFNVNIVWPKKESPALRFTVALKPSRDLYMPFWPRDVVPFGKRNPKGETFISQVGTRSGLLYSSFSKPSTGSFLYLQNLTALGDYNIDTETSAGGIVGGQWPELGLSLPPTKDKPLQKNKSYIISDAYVVLSKDTPGD